ncbi:PDDEXK-like family protein [Thermodesulfatator autotrophicus]|uniref:PD-(D/E)XK nuclease family protein n=1 Tax=Thermodesulfatator autotrophicus TaxID=1795632 RepID=A0A177E433_9BACT|nr:PD-(D/E)XK nuclease family protein [Thermodesulfatator autotrophicus]OAG26727.1 hypothetical protein TH606_10780 [Thermodesulfatator autotrophicus]
MENLLDELLFEYKKLKKQKEEKARKKAFEFNIFEILTLTKYREISNLPEGQISNIIAELLNPSGKHGQGKIFLKLFLEEIKTQIKKVSIEQDVLQILKEDYLLFLSVEREYTTDKGKFIDIIVKLPYSSPNNTLIIAIENKPWAKEQTNLETGYYQIKHYIDFLEKLKNKGEIVDFIFIYLAEDREPVTINKEKIFNLQAEGKFLNLSYTTFLVNWLILCKENSQAEKIKIIIEDFINWILKKFKNEGGENMFVESLKNWLLTSEDNKDKVKLLYEIYQNFPALTRKRFEEIFNKVLEKLKQNYHDIEGQIEKGEDLLCLWIYHKDWEKYGSYSIINYALQVNKIKNLENFYWEIGLSRPEEKGELNYESLKLKSKIEVLIHRIKEKDAEYKYQDNEWWINKWWIIRKEEKDPELIFKIFNKLKLEEIENRWYEEIKKLIETVAKQKSDFVGTSI